MCPFQNLLANINPSELDVGALKTAHANFLVKISGNTKVCIGDTYFDTVTSKKNVVVLCFHSQADVDKLKDSLQKLNPKDLFVSTEKIDPTLEKTFNVWFTDGLEAIITKSLIFKPDGVYEADKLLFNYFLLQPIEKQKCEVYQNLPIFPIKFLEKNLLASKCLLKFKYNNLEVFLGNADKNCEAVVEYIAIKMKTSCLNYINGPGNRFVEKSKSSPFKGEWSGYILYHKLTFDTPTTSNNNSPKSNASENLINDPHLLEIDPNTIKISNIEKSDQGFYLEYKDIRNACNDLGGCNFWEYINFLKKLDPKENARKVIIFENMIKSIREKWLLNDLNYCFVIDTKEVHVICPRDPSEETKLRTAISVAIDNKLIDADSSTFPMNDLSEEYFISYVSDSNPFISESTIKINKDKVVRTENHIEASTYINFLSVKDLYEVSCGFEFRNLSLPPAFHEFSPLCCAKFITNETNYICIQNQAKCYIQLRRMLATMRERCLITKGIKKEDIKLVTNWNGKVVYNEIDNFKDKGESNVRKGILSVNDGDITIQDLETAKPQNFKIDLVKLKFTCLSDYVCSPEEYKTNQEQFLQKGYDREWQESTITKFFVSAKDVKQNDCLIITSENNDLNISQMILVCTEVKDEGFNLKKSINLVYNKKIISLNEKLPEFKLIPSASEYSNYIAYIINSDPTASNFKNPSSETTIMYTAHNILLKDSGKSLFKFEKIIDLKGDKINMFWESPLKKATKEKLNKEINPENCFAISIEENIYINICMKNNIKGIYEKASLFQAIHDRANFKLGQVKKNKNFDDYLKNVKPYDTFDFNNTPNYKNFPPTFNTDSLIDETFQVSKNGKWEGWVYEGTLTERNYKKIFTPVFMKIKDGFIIFSTEENKSPYKILKIHEYEQVCKGHCQPNEYLDYTRRIRTDVDDLMYLEDSINNYMGQMKNPYTNEGCVIMDFISPIFQYGQQHLICATEKTQGEKIRLAIDNVYYTSLLNLDMEKEVKRPNIHTDRYWAKLIINDEIEEAFNSFYIDEYGLVGRSMKPKLGNDLEAQNKQIFNVTYSSIDKDNFGKTCAFWYKGQRIKQRNEKLNNAIFDNNCCFKFYTKNDRRKIELCAYTIEYGICIKQSRELMKGIKSGCIDYEESNALPDNLDDNEKENPIDMYIENTIDDNENGIFTGFAYTANAINSASQPRTNPYFIKVGKASIDIFDSYRDDKPKFIIDLDNIKFSCRGQYSCNPKEFLKYAQTHKEFIPVLNSINTVYQLFKENFSINEKNFNENCLVLETLKAPILFCPFKTNHGLLIKKAISNAFKLKFLRTRIFGIPDPKESKPYKILFKKGLTETNDTVELKTDGLYSITSKKKIFNYFALDEDPVTKAPCAIWYKSLRPPGTNENEAPKENLLNNNCCIRFKVKGSINYLCTDKPDGICVEDTFTIMKSIFNGCKYSNPAMEKIPKSPDSEILGQTLYKPTIKFDSKNQKYQIYPKDRQNSIFEYSQIKKKFFLDTYNEISFSKRRALYQGWVNIYPLPIEGEPRFQILKLYAKISPERFDFFDSSNNKAQLKLSIRPDMLSQTCRKSSCKVYEYLDKFLTKFDQKYEFKKNYYRAKFNFYEMGREDGCTVLENHVENKAEYYIVCPRFYYHRSMSRTIQPLIDDPTSTNRKNRRLLSATFGKVFRDIVFNAYATARKYVQGDRVNELKKEIIHAKVSQIFKQEEHANVTISSEGITASNHLLVKFDDLPNCMINFNLIYVPKEMYTFEKKKIYNQNKQTCCVRYSGPRSQEYVCFGDLNCEYYTYKFAKSFNKNCLIKKNRKNDDIYNEFNAGNNVALKPLLKRAFTEELRITNFDVFQNSTISTDDNIIKQRSIIIKIMYELRDIIHRYNKLDIASSERIAKGKEDLTAPDPIILDISKLKFEPKYIGFNHNKEWEVTAAVNRITKYHDKKKEVDIYIAGNDQYIKSKYYNAIIALKSKYFVVKYNDGDKSFLAEIDGEFKILEDKKWMNNEVKEKCFPFLNIFDMKFDNN
jgi:hypothetical protein